MNQRWRGKNIVNEFGSLMPFYSTLAGGVLSLTGSWATIWAKARSKKVPHNDWQALPNKESRLTIERGLLQFGR